MRKQTSWQVQAVIARVEPEPLCPYTYPDGRSCWLTNDHFHDEPNGQVQLIGFNEGDPNLTLVVPPE